MRYATALAGDPAATYRSIHLASRTAGANAHGLVELLYDELIAALRGAAWGAENHRPQYRNERVTRALAILFALEAGLDFDKGGDISRTLAQLYHGARQRLSRASLGNDPAPFRAVAAELAEIAEAWASLRAG